ncbi:fatty acid desaturase family protein [Salinarimonas chemoclinalis]|uniref:fatty acid desaturase family protein n=1 Tax=Salinarimonas chemoclinalis TaxID=3241599 RepID=UPI003557DA0E
MADTDLLVAATAATAPSARTVPAQAASAEAVRETRLAALQRTPARFLLVYGFALGVIVAAGSVIALRDAIPAPWSVPAVLGAMLVLGLFYAHFTELQHELLHNHAFRSQGLSRALGILCGLPMLSSYAHYRYSHLRHHARLGTPENEEFFDYPKRGLDSPLKLALAALSPGRFVALAGRIVDACLGRPVEGVRNERTAAQIRSEYRLFGLVIAVAIAYTVLTGDLFFVLAWLVPLVLVAEPAHYLIELPEHFGLDVYGEPDPARNTRTIEASALARWYTNGNNLHTIHHMVAGIPMGRCAQAHARRRDEMRVVEPSYWSFYRKVMSGEIRPIAAGDQR